MNMVWTSRLYNFRLWGSPPPALFTQFFALILLACQIGIEPAYSKAGMGNCGTCHQVPNAITISEGFGRSLDVEALERSSPQDLKESLLNFARRRQIIIGRLNREVVCRAIARYIAAQIDKVDSCPDELWSKDKDIRAGIDSASEQQKEYLATIQGTSTKLIQKDLNVVDSLKLLITAGFTLELAPSISVEIYQPTFFQTRRLDGPLVDERIIPKSYSSELTAAQKAIGSNIERLLNESVMKELGGR